jgi:hypothetical protein
MQKVFIPLIILISLQWVHAQDQPDSAVLSFLRKEGADHSRVMDILSTLTDVNGPRLTNSRGYATAAEYAKRELESWGLRNVHFDFWDENFGRGWELKKFTLSQTQPTYAPLIAYPKAWSPDVKGTLRTEAVYLDLAKESDLEKYRGKLKLEIVLISVPTSAGQSCSVNA